MYHSAHDIVHFQPHRLKNDPHRNTGYRPHNSNIYIVLLFTVIIILDVEIYDFVINLFNVVMESCGSGICCIHFE